MSADSSINQDITYEYQDQWRAPDSQRLKRQEEHNEESKYGGWNEDNFAQGYSSPKQSPTSHIAAIMITVDRLVNMDRYFLGWTMRKYRLTAMSVFVCKEMKDKETSRMPWNLHMESSNGHSIVIKAVNVKGIQNTAIKISIWPGLQYKHSLRFEDVDFDAQLPTPWYYQWFRTAIW